MNAILTKQHAQSFLYLISTNSAELNAVPDVPSNGHQHCAFGVSPSGLHVTVIGNFRDALEHVEALTSIPSEEVFEHSGLISMAVLPQAVQDVIIRHAPAWPVYELDDENALGPYIEEA